LKLLYQKEKYKRFNKHKIEKLKRKYRKKKVKKNKYIAELDRHNRLIASKELIKFPEKLYLANKNEEVFALIEKIEGKNDVVLDFSRTKYIDIGSALYIKAFIDHLKDENKRYKITCLSKNKKMRQILQHIEIHNYGIRVTSPDIKCWEIRTWQKGDMVNYGSVMMTEILPKVLKDKRPSDEFSDIAASLQEILSNCSEHAYTENDEYKNYYLIAGEYENSYGKSNSFTFCIIDRGQGFRSSLAKNKNNFFVEIFKNLQSSEHDSDLLKAAINGEDTSKEGGGKLAGRGTGLSNVVENIRTIGGSFCVYSDRGSYKVSQYKDTPRERKIPIKGAIIEMILPINGRKNT